MINIFKNTGNEAALDRIVSNYVKDLYDNDVENFMKKNKDLYLNYPKFLENLYKYNIKDIVESNYLNYATKRLVTGNKIIYLNTTSSLFKILLELDKQFGLEKFHKDGFVHYSKHNDKMYIVFMIKNDKLGKYKNKMKELLEKETKVKYLIKSRNTYHYIVPHIIHKNQYKNFYWTDRIYQEINYPKYSGKLIGPKGEKKINISVKAKKSPKKIKKLTEKSPVSEMKAQLKKMGVRNYSTLTKPQIINKLKQNGYVFQKSYTATELKKICKERNIKYCNKMKKSELMKKLNL
jgi:hypothetical protein